MKINIYYKIILIVLFTCGLYINIMTLDFQCDPFIPSTIIMAETFSEFNNYYDSVDFISNNAKYSAWQGHTKDFIIYEPLSGIINCVISKVTGLNTYSVSYLIIPYFTYCILLYLIFNKLYNIFSKYCEINSKIYSIIVFFVLMTTIYAFICKYVIGKFYVMEYHGIFLIYVLTMFYLLLKYFETNYVENKKILLLMVIIFIANLFTHYNFTMTFTGGLIIFIISLELLKYLGIKFDIKLQSKLKIIALIFIIVLTLQNFYFINLGKSGGNMLETLGILINTLIDRVVGISSDSGIITNSSDSGIITKQSGYIFSQQWMFVKKWWHILFVIVSVILFLSTTIKCLNNKDKKLNINHILYIYILIIGIDATWMFTYFINYGGNLSFYLPNGWILNSLILIPIFYLHNSKEKLWKNIGKLLLLTNILLTLLLVLDSSFELHYVVSGHSPFPYQVREDTKTCSNFLIHNIDNQEIVVGSLESSSALYGFMSSDLKSLEHIFPKPAFSYFLIPGVKYHKSVSDIYKSMKKDHVSKFILTDYEINSGFFGGLTVAPLTPNETKELKNLLELNENVVYDSKMARVYDFNYVD
ncbi:hypothetical protein [Methanotorris igneus]|uniref:Uncharacterized protein n=1 Tax=Methanotorris igneus (strain DSM 5666 / JCM 11834 / Kol 5) TaxID=880724 RepID=F6BAX3_METIK|nr:hypothetical protein [Methanotorris igneus]AEF97060.1 hypothetical protein Metig_1526 [Methanotorris igneus Kol 5]